MDWWALYAKLVQEKDMTRQQIMQMTTQDLRLLVLKEPPPEMGGKLRSAEAVFEKARENQEKAKSWLYL